jgi:malate synthase
VLADGRKVTLELFRKLMREELDRIRNERGEVRSNNGHFTEASQLFDELVANQQLEEFLTLKAYDLLNGETDSEDTSPTVIPIGRPAVAEPAIRKVA